MKINIKARLKNKTFVISSAVLIISFIYSLLSLFGVVPSISEKQVTELVTMGVNALAFFGVLVDPTTSGISDSSRAMTYCTPYDERLIENNDDNSHKERVVN